MNKEHEFLLVAAVVPSLITGVASYLAAIYTVQRGPDYQKQIGDLSAEVGRLSSAYEATLEHQRQLANDDKQRRDAQSWKPKMEIVSDAQKMFNTLHIQADKHFSIETVRLKTSAGAIIGSFDIESPKMMIRADFQIPDDALDRLVKGDNSYVTSGITAGLLECILQVGIPPRQMHFEIPVRVIQDVKVNLGGRTIWRRLEGRS